MIEKRYVARGAMTASRALGDETMIMSAANAALFTLNDVATVIWEAADGSTPLDEIVFQKVCTQYDVTPEQAFRDAEDLAEKLAGHGLLQISDAPIVKSQKSEAQ